MNSAGPVERKSPSLLIGIAIGNPLRGDDGVAHRVLELLSSRRDIRTRSLLQLNPEIAFEIANAKSVFFVDADVSGHQPTIEPIPSLNSTQPPLSHQVTPGEIVTLARKLFGFSGQAFLCRVPAFHFEDGEKLSLEAEKAARQIADMIESAVKAVLYSGSVPTNKP